MTEIAVTKRPLIRRLLRTIFQNPVTVKELRSRMRGWRAVILLTGYLVLMSLFITFLYIVYAAASNEPFGPDPRLAGKVVFGAVLGVEVLLVVFIAPSFTLGAISGEKERQTYNLLRTTLLPARSLVTGKLLSALSYVFLLILASLPLQSIAFLLGGVSLAEVLLSQLLILVSALAFAMLGLFFSSLMRSTLSSSIVTYIAAMLLIVALPALALILVPLFGTIFSGTTIDPIFEVILVYVGLFAAALNLPATIVISELFLLQADSLFVMTETISGYRVYLFSPWLVYIAVYSLLSLLLYALTVLRVRRIPTK